MVVSQDTVRDEVYNGSQDRIGCHHFMEGKLQVFEVKTKTHLSNTVTKFLFNRRSGLLIKQLVMNMHCMWNTRYNVSTNDRVRSGKKYYKQLQQEIAEQLSLRKTYL